MKKTYILFFVLFAVYGENNLLHIKFAENSVNQDNKLIFTATIPHTQDTVCLIKAFIWDEELKPLAQEGCLRFSDNSESTNKIKVAPVTGVSFE